MTEHASVFLPMPCHVFIEKYLCKSDSLLGQSLKETTKTLTTTRWGVFDGL
jgi:hypothetical protein